MNRMLRWLWNPFMTTAGGPALGVGVVILLATSAIGALSNTHFDGVLDVHSGRSAPLWFFLAEGVINWLSLALVLWIAGWLLNRGRPGFRALDLIGTQALARWPFLPVAAVCLLPGYGRFVNALNESLQAMSGGKLEMPVTSTVDMLTFWAVVGVMLLAVVWFVALAWKSFRASCDVGGWKAVVAFIIGIIAGEVISKVAIIALFPLI